MKTLASTLSLTVALCAGSAFAAQNVANTSQKGSLLIFPLITVDPADTQDTLIEISNDANSAVHVECYYVNERKGRVDFDFHLSAKATASWDVKTLQGDQMTPAAWPTNGFYPGNANRGALACFATDAGRQNQIAFNHLTGTATVIDLNDSTAGVRQPRQAFRYNPWSFVARSATGLPEQDNVAQGAPGRLNLTGGGAGTYDACPSYNIAKFMPNRAALGNLTTFDNTLSVVSCNQDLRQDFVIYQSKLQFTVWNSRENSFTGSYVCVDSVNSVPLGVANRRLVNGAHFEYSTLQSQNARFNVKGMASSQCPGRTYNVGLLGVLASSVGIGTSPTGEDQEIGSSTQGAGVQPGFVLWDPADAVQFRARQ